MKILRLEVLNLASLVAVQGQPQAVDFRLEPLLSAGLSAITGPTGAGKSTLLDALCLALFDEVPRLRSASHGQEGKLPDVGQSLAFGDKRNLLSRGSGYGSAVVEFLGIDGQHYRAVWEVQRARKRLDGAMQKVNRSLHNLSTDQQLTAQKSECAVLIPQLIGMNFEQFTRAVLLAQTEFGVFLKAGDQERAQLLECLTDTGIYSKIGVLAYQYYKAAKAQFDQLQVEYGFVQALSLDARQALDLAVEKQLAIKQELNIQQEQYRQVQRWMEQDQACQSARQQARHQQDYWQQQWQSSHAIRQDLIDYQALMPYRQWQAEHQHTTQQQHIIAQRITTLKHAQQQAQIQTEQAYQALLTQQQHMTTAQHTYQQQMIWLENAKPLEFQLKTHRAQYIDQQQQLKQLQHHYQPQLEHQQRLQHTIHQYQAKLTHVQVQYQRYADWLDVAHTHAKWLAQHAVQWQNSLKQYQDFAQQTELKQHDVIQAKQQQDQRLIDYQTHLQCYGELSVLQHQRQQLEQAIHHTTQQLATTKHTLQLAEQSQHLYQQQQQYEQQLRQLELIRHQAETAYQQQQHTLAAVEQLYHQQQQRHDQWVTHLRTTLQPDQPCPVCGSLKHPFIANQDSLAEQLLNESHQQYLLAQQRLQDCQTDYQHADHQYHLTQQQLDWILTQQQRHTHDATPLHDLDGLTQKINQLQTDITHAQQQSDQLQLYIIQQHELMQLAEQATILYHNLHEQHGHLEQHRQHLHQHWCEQESILLKGLPVSHQTIWQQALLPERLDLLDTWQQALQQREQLHIQITTLEHTQHEAIQEFERNEHRLIHLSQQIDTTIQQLEKLRIDGQVYKQALQHCLDHAQPAVDSLDAWEKQLAQQQDNQKLAIQDAQNKYNQHDRSLHGLMSALDEQQQQQQRLNTQCIQLEQHLKTWRQTHPHFDDTQLERLLSWSTDQWQQAQQHVQDLQQKQLTQQSKTDQLEQQWQQLQQDRPSIAADLQPDQITTQLQHISINLIQAEQDWASLYGQQTEDNRKQQQTNRLQDAMTQAQQQYHRWSKLAEPIGCSTGAKFRKIAQSYQLDVLLQYANQQLTLLSPRYRLQRAHDSLGLLVIDQDMANEQRAVHSLSGGESFLMSLALALGLAQMASGHVKIESLFIDEGFGSLDPESLQMVMDALDQLQSQGRKVIVITHVQEMQERIPTQIQVQRLGAGRSRIVITPSLPYKEQAS